MVNKLLNWRIFYAHLVIFNNIVLKKKKKNYFVNENLKGLENDLKKEIYVSDIRTSFNKKYPSFIAKYNNSKMKNGKI